MAKTENELNELREEVAALQEKLSSLSEAELGEILSEEELDNVSGGAEHSGYTGYYVRIGYRYLFVPTGRR